MSITSLASNTCTPFVVVSPLTVSEVAAHQQQTPEGSVLVEAHRIERTYRFKNFAEAYSLLGRSPSYPRLKVIIPT